MRIRLVPLRLVIQKCTSRKTCSIQRFIYVIIAFVFWSSLFAWLSVVSRLRDTVTMSRDYRLVPELSIPPVEVTDRQTTSIRWMIEELQSQGLLMEPTTNIYNDKYPRWPFKVRRGDYLLDPEERADVNDLDPGEKFSHLARQYALYDPDETDIDQLLNDMATRRVDYMEEVEKGTQLKFKLTLRKYGPIMFKPQRYDRSYETSPNHFYFSDYERHNSEIASFHLDRLLGWHRTPPVVGRLVNVTRDLEYFAKDPLLDTFFKSPGTPLYKIFVVRCVPERRRLDFKLLGWYRAPPVVGRWVNVTKDLRHFTKGKLRNTFFKSPADNYCFTGRCKYYCDTTNAFCGNPYMLEGSLATFLPPTDVTKLYKIKSPWRRSYRRDRLANWRTNDTYCDGVRLNWPDFRRQPRRLLDIIDTHIFDFLIGNMDRHHYLFYHGFPNNDTFHLHFDHGRGFGRINHDELSILGPLVQCCSIRYTTLYKLWQFYEGRYRLSHLLMMSLAQDPVSPVLADGHYTALDRRVVKILSALANCLHTKPISKVIINDGF